MASPATKQNATDSKTVTDTIVGKAVTATARNSGPHALLEASAAVVGSDSLVLCACCLSTSAGEHTHTIVGYSLIKGIGDGEPIASERFTVGGHEWVRQRAASLLLIFPKSRKAGMGEHQAAGIVRERQGRPGWLGIVA